MTGPPYPRSTASSAIGGFVIGVSPIGVTPGFDFWATIISQYANSAILTQLIDNFAQYVEPTVLLDAFFDDIWNVDTAQGYGLDVWGRIVGVDRVIQVINDENYLGFEESADPTLRTGFGQGPFFSGNPLTDNFALTDTAFRTLIFAKALANICDGSIAAINQLLRNLFKGRGNCYVTDGGDMTMTYTFVFALSSVEEAIVRFSGVLPTPAGVQATFVIP